MENQSLQLLRMRIGSSFLKSFYPQDYREINNEKRRLKETSNLETKKLRRLSESAAKMQQSISRVLSLLSGNITDLLNSTDNLQAQIAASDEVLGNSANNLKNSLDSITDLLLGGYLIKKANDVRVARKTAAEEARVRADEEARLKAEGEKAPKVKTDAEVKAKGATPDATLTPKVEGPKVELEAPRVQPKVRAGSGLAGIALSTVASGALAYGASKVTEGVTSQYKEQAVAEPIPGPPPMEAPPGQELAPSVQWPQSPDAPDLSPYAPPGVSNPQTEALMSQAEALAKPIVEQYESSASFGITPQGLGSAEFAETPTMTTLHTSKGSAYQVNATLAPNFDGFVKALEATGYDIKSIGGYADRNIAGSSQKSYHALGAAIDINPGANPHLKDGTIQTDMPPDIGALAASFGLGWGGNWRSSKDTMHFSAAASEMGSFDISRETGQIIPLAAGGKVSRPTLALIGEGGEPEYVVPQSKAKAFAHEMMASERRTKTKRHTHYVLMPIS